MVKKETSIVDLVKIPILLLFVSILTFVCACSQPSAEAMKPRSIHLFLNNSQSSAKNFPEYQVVAKKVISEVRDGLDEITNYTFDGKGIINTVTLNGGNVSGKRLDELLKTALKINAIAHGTKHEMVMDHVMKSMTSNPNLRYIVVIVTDGYNEVDGGVDVIDESTLSKFANKMTNAKDSILAFLYLNPQIEPKLKDYFSQMTAEKRAVFSTISSEYLTDGGANSGVEMLVKAISDSHTQDTKYIADIKEAKK